MNIAIVVWILSTGAADVSNERIQVSGAELEQHWQLDCRGMLDDYNNLILTKAASDLREIKADVLRDLASVAQKCSFIYNQKGTGREIACPDYKRVSDNLQDLVSRGMVEQDSATKTPDLKIETCGE